MFANPNAVPKQFISLCTDKKKITKSMYNYTWYLLRNGCLAEEMNEPRNGQRTRKRQLFRPGNPHVYTPVNGRPLPSGLSLSLSLAGHIRERVQICILVRRVQLVCPFSSPRTVSVRIRLSADDQPVRYVLLLLYCCRLDLGQCRGCLLR